MSTSKSNEREKVLPSGRFAKGRPLIGRDYLDVVTALQSGQLAVFVLISLSVTIDDQPVRYEDLLEMDMRDINALVTLVSEYTSGPMTSI